MHPLSGRKQSAEHIAKRTARLIGRIPSEETKKKISAALLGKPSTSSTKFKPGCSTWNKGNDARKEYICEICLVLFYAHLRSGEVPRYCSQKCAYSDRKRNNHANWKGGRVNSTAGYVMIRVGGRKNYRYEHVLMAEKALGRPLKFNEHVHHVNGIKNDNRNDNFLICSNSYHRLLERIMMLAYQFEHFKKLPHLVAIRQAQATYAGR